MEEKRVTVKLKEFTLTLDGMEPVKILYKDLFIGALNMPPEGGLTPLDMRDRIKLMVKIENPSYNGSVDFTLDEFNMLHEMAQSQRFAVVNKGFVAYIDYLEEIKKGLD